VSFSAGEEHFLFVAAAADLSLIRIEGIYLVMLDEAAVL